MNDTMEEKDEKDENICTCCFEKILNNPKILSCGHQFHTDCFLEWGQLHNGWRICPNCRDLDVTRVDDTVSMSVETFEHHVEKMDNQAKELEYLKESLLDIQSSSDFNRTLEESGTSSGESITIFDQVESFISQTNTDLSPLYAEVASHRGEAPVSTTSNSHPLSGESGPSSSLVYPLQDSLDSRLFASNPQREVNRVQNRIMVPVFSTTIEQFDSYRSSSHDDQNDIEAPDQRNALRYSEIPCYIVPKSEYRKLLKSSRKLSKLQDKYILLQDIFKNTRNMFMEYKTNNKLLKKNLNKLLHENESFIEQYKIDKKELNKLTHTKNSLECICDNLINKLKNVQKKNF